MRGVRGTMRGVRGTMRGVRGTMRGVRGTMRGVRGMPGVRGIAISLIFCLHYTTEHTQRLRHGRVGQLGPRYILIVTMNLQQSG